MDKQEIKNVQQELDSINLQTKHYKIFQETNRTKKIIIEQIYNTLSIIPLSVSEKERKELDDQIKALNLDTTPERVMSASMLILLLLLGLSALTFLLTSSITNLIAALIITFFTYKYVRGYPKAQMKARKLKSSTELVMSILYLVIHMRHSANLEGAVKFASENLEGPLARDYKKMLWDVEAKKYSTIKDALDDYVQTWKETNSEYIDSIYLIVSSMYQSAEDKRLALLDKALDRILEGTLESMVHYANDLKNPIEAVYMLGITLPIFGLITMPIIGAFLSELISTKSLMIVYDIILPSIVLILIEKVLKNRPVAFSFPDLSKHPEAPPRGTFIIKAGNKRIAIPAIIPSAAIFIIGIIPITAYLLMKQTSTPSEWDVYISLIPIVTTSLAIFLYTHLTTYQVLKIRSSIENIELQFADSAFQLGNRIGEGLPVEMAIIKVATTMKGTETADFFMRVANNMQKLGYPVEQAIFDDRAGAIRYFPSHIVRVTMKVTLQGAKKSLNIAASSLFNVSRYLKNIHLITEKIKDVLAETLSSLSFQASIVAPLIAGIVVGLTAMIMQILTSLSMQIDALQFQAEGTQALGVSSMWSLGFFNIKNAIPLHFFQLIVGAYFIEVVVLMMYLAAKIENAGDIVKQKQKIGNTLVMATIVYILVTLGVTILFGGLAKFAIVLGG